MVKGILPDLTTTPP